MEAIIDSIRQIIIDYGAYAIAAITGAIAVWFFRGSIASEATGWMKKFLLLLVLDSLYRVVAYMLEMQNIVILATKTMNDGLFKIMNENAVILLRNGVTFTVSALLFFWIIGRGHLPGHHHSPPPSHGH